MDLGIDVVIHSGTKYIGGHSDLCCGAAVASKVLIEKIKASAANFGGSLNALTCYLIERSLKTLGLRVDRQNQNALTIARKLADKVEISTVYYPGLESHPGFDIASRQMQAFGGMVSFELDTSRVDTHQFLRRLKLVCPALSLGGVETIVCAPAVTSHSKISDAEREELGITDGLLRLSVGIEDPGDILADIEQAFGI